MTTKPGLSNASESAASRPDIAALYTEHRDRVWAAAYKQAGPQGREIAEDAVNEIFVSLLRKCPEDVKNWAAYLITAVKNKVKDLQTSAYAKRERANSETVYDVEGETGHHGHAELDPAVVVVRNERATLVTDALREVREADPDAADALWKVKVLGYTSSEVAQEAGVSASRVRQRVATGRDLMKIALAQKGVQND